MPDRPPPPDWLEVANLHATVAQLLSHVVHQANNALQTIGGHAELLMTDPGVSDATRRRAGTITSVAEHTAEMLANLHAFARAADERLVVNLREIADRALSYHQYGRSRTKIARSVESSGATRVEGDARSLLQIVLNLIFNAEQALSDVEGARLALTIVRHEGSVVLTVDDNGPGCPADTERQELARGWTVGPANRLGLGLVVSASITERLGGSFAITSAPGGGTRAIVSLPAANA